MNGTKPTSGTAKLKEANVYQYKLILNGKEYTNMETTPNNYFELEVNSNKTLTISKYLCGNHNEKYGEYLDVVIPEKLKVFKGAILNREKFIQAEIEDGVTEEEAQANYIIFIMDTLFAKNISMKKFDIEDYKIMFEYNEGMEAIYYITRDEIREIKEVKLNNDKCLSTVKAAGCTEEQAKEECSLYLKLEEEPDPILVNSFVTKEAQANPDILDYFDIEYYPNGYDLIVTKIGDSVFEDNRLTSVVIPDSVTHIDDSVFSYNPLVSVEIGKGITYIDEYAFNTNVASNFTSGINLCDRMITSVKIKAPKPQVKFYSFESFSFMKTFGWKDGYSDDNIEWASE